MITLELEGVDAVAKIFQELEKALAKKIIQKAIKTSLPPTKDMAQQLAPRKTGALSAAIQIRSAKRSRKGFGQNVQIGRQNFTGDSWYGGPQEFGWKSGKRSSANRRQIPGKHFLKQAFSKTKEAAKRRAINEIRRGIREQLQKR